MRAIPLTTLLSTLAITLTGCASTGSHIDRYQHLVRSITAADVTAFEDRHGGRVGSDEIADMQRVTEALASRQTGLDNIEVHVLRSTAPNAFALATGHVYITSGLFDLICTEDELAAVIAHELAHIEEMSELSAMSGADHDKLLVEADADARAIDFLIDAHYDPAALTAMIEKLTDEQPAGWATHRTDQLDYLLGQPTHEFCE